MKNPKVSVCVVTYNQEKYIRQCLQSIVDQETDFDFEVIVGDDASTDGTSAIVDEFASHYPNKVRVIRHQKNVGPVKNILSVYTMAKGQYIAHLDGDDYCLPNKLMVQAGVLDAHLDCMISAHAVCVVDEAGNIVLNNFRVHKKQINTLCDLYQQLPFFVHSSKMFRNNINKESFWRELSDNTLDIEIHVHQAKKGLIFYTTDILGAYREKVGVTNKGGKVNPSFVAAGDRVFNLAMSERECSARMIRYAYAKALFEYAYQSALLGDLIGLQNYVSRSIRLYRISITQIVFFALSGTPKVVVELCRLRRSFMRYKRNRVHWQCLH